MMLYPAAGIAVEKHPMKTKLALFVCVTTTTAFSMSSNVVLMIGTLWHRWALDSVSPANGVSCSDASPMASLPVIGAVHERRPYSASRNPSIADANASGSWSGKGTIPPSISVVSACGSAARRRASAG